MVGLRLAELPRELLDPDDLERTILWIREEIGFDKTLDFLEVWEGQLVYFPKLPRDALVGVLGADAALRLCRRAGSIQMVVPSNQRMKQNAFAKLIQGEYQGGLTVNQLIEKYGCYTWPQMFAIAKGKRYKSNPRWATGKESTDTAIGRPCQLELL